jgi:LssY-like putative type I secretion system component LssY
MLFITAATALYAQESAIDNTQVDPPNDRLFTQSNTVMTVSAAVPSLKETQKVFGTNLYRKNIQPVWVRVQNHTDDMLIITPMGLDAGYYTARESAHRSIANPNDRPPSGKFEGRAMSRIRIPANSVRAGYIFSRVDEGTKSFNVDVYGGGQTYKMSFHIPVPGLKLYNYDLDINSFFPEEQYKDVNLPELAKELEAMPCCVVDAKGKNQGDPLNLVFVGSRLDMYYAFMRAGWDETESIHTTSLLKTAASAISGGRYRYSPISKLYLFNRPQDSALQKARESIHERNHLRLWMTPLRHDGKPVWIGQISRDIGVRFTTKTITTHKIDPDVDETREYLVEDMAYAGTIAKLAYVPGVGPATYDQPRNNLTGDPYFTDGRRVVMWLSEGHTAITEIELINLEDTPANPER